MKVIFEVFVRKVSNHPQKAKFQKQWKRKNDNTKLVIQARRSRLLNLQKTSISAEIENSLSLYQRNHPINATAEYAEYCV